jgi:hypothetical protein
LRRDGDPATGGVTNALDPAMIIAHLSMVSAAGRGAPAVRHSRERERLVVEA